MQIAMINDKVMAMSEVGPEYMDRGIFFGDGVYEVLRSYNGKIFAFEEHLERFTNSLEAIEITGVDMGQVRSKVKKAFDKAAISNAKIYFHITRGSGPRDHTAGKDLKPNFFLTITELKEDLKLKTEGVSVSIYPDLRWKRCDIKSLNLLANVLAKNDAAKKDCWEAIFVNDVGLVTEGSSSAFFAIMGDKLQTSELSTHILPSITRKFVIKAARNIGLKIVEESLTPVQARTAAELFLGVTTKDIVPVVRFDGQAIGDGRPGRWTKALIEEFKKFIV
jgi:D-alanine transaminase